jgi:hypothetical protein
VKITSLPTMVVNSVSVRSRDVRDSIRKLDTNRLYLNPTKLSGAASLQVTSLLIKREMSNERDISCADKIRRYMGAGWSAN